MDVLRQGPKIRELKVKKASGAAKRVPKDKIKAETKRSAQEILIMVYRFLEAYMSSRNGRKAKG